MPTSLRSKPIIQTERASSPSEAVAERLGEGWRLPSLEEMKVMYRTIGPGATNIGEFADELYWSATPYDEFQARLLRFGTGNSSYHYNSMGDYRKFRIRAVQDFKR